MTSSKLRGITVKPFIVALCAAFFCSPLFATPNEYIGGSGGDWFTGENWSGGVPSAGDDVVIESTSVVAPGSIHAKSLTLKNATLTIGNKSTHVFPVIVGDVTLNGASKLYVQAGELTDYSVFETDEKAMKAIREAVNIVTIGGNFTVNDTSVVYPECGELTGVPVIFKVANDFTLAASASFNTIQLGWGWSSDAWEGHPAYAKPSLTEGKKWKDEGWTFAFGAAWGRYGSGSNYGCESAGMTATRDEQSYRYEQSYGYAISPFMPGSPASGHYAKTLAEFRKDRGSGSIVVFAQGAMQVDGRVIADGVKGGGGGTSGGGIMLAAQSFSFGDSASLSANGGDQTTWVFGNGRGGRIALLLGFSDAELMKTLEGILPAGAEVEPSIDMVSASVLGGSGTSDRSGTCATVMSGNLQATLTTASDVPGLVAEGVTWGDQVLLNGSYEFTTSQYAYLAADAGVRYTCAGWVVSNATEEVDSGEGLIATVQIKGSDGPYSLTWHWVDCKVKVNGAVNGGGSITYDGTAYTEDFELFVPFGAELSFTAAADEGWKFISWSGTGVPGGYSAEKTIAVTLTGSSTLAADFASGVISRAWVGAKDSNWNEASNWSPAGVPGEEDEVCIEDAAVVASQVKVAKLVLLGGSLTLGSDAVRENFEFSVSGDVTVCDGAVLNVYAPFKSDPADYTSVAAARELLWQNRTKFSVGGAFSVSEGATVRVDNHPETGDLVVFEVGAFDLAAGGTVTAAGTGFTWLPSAGKDLPTETIMKTGTANIGGVYTFAFGAGSSYGTPADHSYGLDIAPFEPGSCGGAYSGTGLSRGGGSIVVFAKGAVTLNGTLNADSVRGSSYSGPSGGSIWITGATIDRGDGLVATARGQAEPTNGNYGIGAGGRVAFMTDVTTDEQIERMVGGEKLEGYAYETLSFEGLSVDSGLRNGKPSGTAGTAVSAFDASNYETVTVTASPLEAVSPLAKYGSFQTKGGETVVREADVIGGDPVDPQNVRYICTGYVVSNATEQVAEGRTTTLSFPVVKGTGPYTVTWLWGIRQTRSRLSVTGPGTVTVNGQTVNELWIPDTEDVVFVATPDADKAFWTWSGDDVPPMDAAKTSFAILASKPHVVNAVFVDLAAAAKTSTLKATASGDFYNPMNWESEVVPNPQDAIAIPGGACKVLGRFACASLTMSGGSLSIAQAEEAVISGDVALSGGSVWTVTAVPTNTATAFADGATRVKIGGDLVMEDAVTVKPVSDPWTGGSVAFSVAGDFTLSEAAKFDAVGAGWGWVEYTGDPSPCAVDKAAPNGHTVQTMAIGRGADYRLGGSYGGLGGNRVDESFKYGFANAPVHPGSPNGVNNSGTGWDYYLGGGLIRIHIGGLATVAGTLDASTVETYTGGSSGGGIWLTAEKFVFAPTAVLRAVGGDSSTKGSHTYNSMGGGGRIAIGTGLSESQITRLAQTGVCGRRARGETEFERDFPGVNVPDVSGGTDRNSGNKGGSGSFSYYPTPKGLLLLVK